MKTIQYYNIGQYLERANEINGQSPALLSINSAELKNENSSLVHSHEYLEVFYILEGEGAFVTGHDTVELKKGDVLAVNAGVVHCINANTSTLKFYSLLLDNINIGGLGVNCISLGNYAKFRDDKMGEIIDDVITELTDKKEGFYLYVKGLIYSIVATLARNIPTTIPQMRNENRVAIAVKEYIDENYTSEITLPLLSQIAFVNKYYLIHSFKKAYNISPMQYVTAVRINKATTLLRRTELSISEIAAQIGYDNPVYFAEQFKRTIGTTPSIYRKITGMKHDII